MPHCRCGCGSVVRNEFARGHVATYLSSLLRRAEAGDFDARRELYERGWSTERPVRIGRRAFGIEAEFFGMSQNTAVSVLTSFGIRARDDGYHHQTRPYWRVTEDGSVSAEGCELVSPILAGSKREDMATARQALDVLRQEGGQINSTCGLHVHHTLGGKTARDVAETVGHWALFQPIINRILPSSRHDGDYCNGMYDSRRWRSDVLRWSPSGDDADARTVDGHRFGRYHAVNLNAIQDHGTLEYRQHSGTLNPNKMEHWVRFTRAMHDVANIGTIDTLLGMYGSEAAVQRDMTVGSMMEYLRLPRATREFYRQRELALRNDTDDEGADHDTEPGYDDYNDDGGIWCDNCDEYHYED